MKVFMSYFEELGLAESEQTGYQHILEQVSLGNYRLPIAGKFSLDQVREAHAEMALGQHIGKYIFFF